MFAALLDARWAPVAADAVGVVVPEVVAIAVQHGRGVTGARLQLIGDRVRFEVEDASSEPPDLVPVDVWATSGKGLHIVEDYTDCWGVEALPDACGKRVWFEMRCIEGDTASRP